MKTEQNVVFAIAGPNIEYTYEHPTTAADSDEVEMAEIADVDLETTTVDGEPQTQLVVTVENPSPHGYQLTVLAHTETLQGRLAHPNAAPNESDTVRIDIPEAPGDLVRGELRLYAGDMYEANTTLDMVTFEGRTDATTTLTDTAFERIDDPGHYSLGQGGEADERALAADDGPTDLGIAVGIMVAGVVALLGLLGVAANRRLA